MRRTILLDLDGTVTDPKVGITGAVQYALGELGIHVDDPDTLCPFIGPPLHDSFMRLYGMDRAGAEEAVRLYRVYYQDRGIFENIPYPGMEEMLRSLREAGRAVLLATSKPTVYAQRILDHFGLAAYFDFVAGSELDGSRSGKDAVIRYALAGMDIRDPATAVMVGDTRYDILGARACGLASVGVLYGYGAEASLREAGADWIVPTVAALGECLLTL